MLRAAEKLSASEAFIRHNSLLELWAASVSDFYMYILYMGLATPTVTSFLVSQLLPLLPSIPAAFLTLPTTQVLLVTSPARPDCRN